MIPKKRSLKQAALVLIIFLLTAGLLFGGEILAQRFFERNPLDEKADSIPAVKSFEIKDTGKGLKLAVTMEKVKNLRESLEPFIHDVQEIKNNKVTGVKITGSSPETLEDVYYELSFPLEEARVSGNYTLLFSFLEKLEKENGGNFKVYIGEEFFYIQLEDTDGFLYHVLPKSTPVNSGMEGGNN